VNLLQRVAASSTRTSAPLRAPATPPPLMPEFPVFTTPEANAPASVELGEQEEPEPTRPAPIPPAPAKTAPRPPIARHEEATPKKPAQPSTESAAVKPPSVPRPEIVQTPIARPNRTVVQAPKLWRARNRNPAPAHILETEQPAAVPPRPSTLPPPMEVKVPHVLAAPPAASQTPATQQAPTTSQALAKPATRPEPQPARASNPLPAPRAETPAPSPSRPVRRESRIHIGRVDVRVNNTSATPQSRPAKAPPPPALHWLETRYLNRFSFRP
jgi:ribonuclease R